MYKMAKRNIIVPNEYRKRKKLVGARECLKKNAFYHDHKKHKIKKVLDQFVLKKTLILCAFFCSGFHTMFSKLFRF